MFFPPEKGNILGVLKEIWHKKGKAGWAGSSGCCGLGHTLLTHVSLIFVPFQ
jgi:hypothetical protein